MQKMTSYRQQVEYLASLQANKQYREAYDLVLKLLEIYPYAPLLYVYHYKLVLLLDEPEEEPGLSIKQAYVCLTTATTLEPRWAIPWIERGYFEYAVLDHVQDAMASFQQAQLLAERSLQEALVGQAKCHLDRGDQEQAQSIYEYLQQMFPNDEYGLIFDLSLRL